MSKQCVVAKPMSTSSLFIAAGAFVGAMFLTQYIGAPAGAAVGTFAVIYVLKKM